MRFILPCVLQRWWNRCSENTLPKDTKLECGQSRILNSRLAWCQIHRQHKNIGRGSPKVLRTAVWVLQSEGEWVGSQSLWGGAVLRGPQCWWSKRRGAGEKERLGPGGIAVRFGVAPMQMAKRRPRERMLPPGLSEKAYLCHASPFSLSIWLCLIVKIMGEPGEIQTSLLLTDNTIIPFTSSFH